MSPQRKPMKLETNLYSMIVTVIIEINEDGQMSNTGKVRSLVKSENNNREECVRPE